MMIERLKHEHRDFESRLFQIEESSRANLKHAIEMLEDLGKSILRHANRGRGKNHACDYAKSKRPF